MSDEPKRPAAVAIHFCAEAPEAAGPQPTMA